MKLRLLLPLLIVTAMFVACSNKDDLFDDSRRCSLQSEDVTDAFGTVIKKSDNNDDCQEIPLDPCGPQLKNRQWMGEVTDDTKNSMIVCPEVQESPILPSDYTEDNSGEIDISESLENEDASAVKDLNAKKTLTEAEEIVANTPVVEDKISQEQKSKTTKSIHAKNTKKTSKKSTHKKTSQNVVKKSPKRVKKAQKTVQKKTASRRGQLVYKMSLGPFYAGKTYVPYRVKVDFEKHIRKVKAKYKKGQKFHYKFTAYFPSGRGAEGKRIAVERATQLIQYAAWKEKIDEGFFQLIVQPTTVRSQAQKVDILVFTR